jgi:hypothetical protein
MCINFAGTLCKEAGHEIMCGRRPGVMTCMFSGKRRCTAGCWPWCPAGCGATAMSSPRAGTALTGGSSSENTFVETQLENNRLKPQESKK